MYNFKVDIQNTNWDNVLRCNDPQQAYTTFIYNFSAAYDDIPTYIPRCKKVKDKPWLTKSLIKCIKKKNYLYSKYRKKHSHSNEVIYKTYRNRLTHILRGAKKNFFQNKFNKAKDNIKQTWNIINNLLSKKTHEKISPKFTVNNHSVTDPSNISNGFNDYFVNIGPQLASKIPNSSNSFKAYLKDPHASSLFHTPATSKEIIDIFKKLKEGSGGHDNINVKFAKHVADQISIPLAHIFNLSLSSGIIPNEMKIAKVTPIYKEW